MLFIASDKGLRYSCLLMTHITGFPGFPEDQNQVHCTSKSSVLYTKMHICMLFMVRLNQGEPTKMDFLSAG